MEYSNFELKSKLINGKRNLYVKVVSTGKTMYIGEISRYADIHKLYDYLTSKFQDLILNGVSSAAGLAEASLDFNEKDVKIMLEAMDYLVYLDKFLKSKSS